MHVIHAHMHTCTHTNNKNCFSYQGQPNKLYNIDVIHAYLYSFSIYSCETTIENEHWFVSGTVSRLPFVCTHATHLCRCSTTCNFAYDNCTGSCSEQWICTVQLYVAGLQDQWRVQERTFVNAFQKGCFSSLANCKIYLCIEINMDEK